MSRLRTGSRYVLGALFVLAGINHFRAPDFYVRMMPAYLPWPVFLVQLSGVAESALGLAFLFRKTRVPAAWGLVALLIAVFPANLNMAIHSEQFTGVPEWATLVRLPLQVVLVAWVVWSADRHARASA